MVIILIVFCITVCLASGYVGGYTIDRQFQQNAIFRRVPIRYPWKKLFVFGWSIPNEAILLGMIFELSGLLFSSTMVIACAVQRIINAHIEWFLPFSFLMCHGVFLILVSAISYIKYIKYKNTLYTKDAHVWIYEMRKAITTKPVICTALVMELPSETSNNLYLIRSLDILSHDYYATCAPGCSPVIGNHVQAIYKSEHPHFHILSVEIMDDSRNGHSI